MAETPEVVESAGTGEDVAAAPVVRRSPGHRAMDVRDAVAELTQRAHEISAEASNQMAGAMRDVIGAAAGIATFAIESARDLVQYMVRRGQMSQDEADRLLRDAEAAAAAKRPRPDVSAAEPAPKSARDGGKTSAASPEKPAVRPTAGAEPMRAQPAPKAEPPARPAAKTATKPAPKAATKTTAKAAAKPAPKPAAKVARTAKPAGKTAGKPAAKAAGGKSATSPAAKPRAKGATKSSAKSAAKAPAKPAKAAKAAPKKKR